MNKINQFPERLKWPKTYSKQTNNLNILISTKETECVIKILLTKKTPNPDALTSEIYQLIFLKMQRKIQWRKNNLHNKWCWNKRHIYSKKMKNLYLYLTLHATINSKRIIDLNVTQKTVTFLKKTQPLQ